MKRKLFILLGILIILATVAFLMEDPFELLKKKPDEESLLIFPEIDVDNINKIELHSAERVIHLIKEAGEWSVREAEGDIFPADNSSIKRLTKEIEELKRHETVSRDTEKHSLFEVDDKGVVVKAFMGDEDAPSVHFIIGKRGPDFMSTYFRVEGKEEVHLVRKSISYTFDRDIRLWKDKKILNLPRDAIVSLILNPGDKGEIKLDKDEEGKWHLTIPEFSPVKEPEVNKILNTFSNLNAYDIVGKGLKPDYGLDSPELTATATLDDGQTHTIIAGAIEDNRYYVQVEGEEFIYHVAKGRIENFIVNTEKLKEEVEEPEEE